MCGRYAQTRNADRIARDFLVDQVVDELTGPSWNVAPTQDVPVVLERVEDDDVDRQLRVLHWGLVPSWAKDTKVGARMINARSETVLDKPAFRRAAAHRRALVPMDGYYEWQQPAEPGARKIPYYLHADDPLAAAGLYELWRDPSKTDEDPSRWLWSLTIITRPAHDELGHIHDRCPLLLPPDRWEDWLNPRITAPDEVGAMMAHVPEPRLQPREVSPAVGNVRNNSADLIAPAHPGQVDARRS